MRGIVLKFFILQVFSMLVYSFITRPKPNPFFRIANERESLLFLTKGAHSGRKRLMRTSSNSNSPRSRNTKTVQNRKPRNPKTKLQKLLEPTIIFTNNHLVLVNKPPGYHSQPNESPSLGNNAKCLLTKLKSMQMGGGSEKNFLLPMHRLDQVRSLCA